MNWAKVMTEAWAAEAAPREARMAKAAKEAWRRCARTCGWVHHSLPQFCRGTEARGSAWSISTGAGPRCRRAGELDFSILRNGGRAN